MRDEEAKRTVGSVRNKARGLIVANARRAWAYGYLLAARRNYNAHHIGMKTPLSWATASGGDDDCNLYASLSLSRGRCLAERDKALTVRIYTYQAAAERDSNLMS